MPAPLYSPCGANNDYERDHQADDHFSEDNEHHSTVTDILFLRPPRWITCAIREDGRSILRAA